MELPVLITRIATGCEESIIERTETSAFSKALLEYL